MVPNTGLAIGLARGWGSWPEIGQQAYGLNVQDSPLTLFELNDRHTRSLASVGSGPVDSDRGGPTSSAKHIEAVMVSW